LKSGVAKRIVLSWIQLMRLIGQSLIIKMTGDEDV
jgi:hypothetical protein